MTVSTPSVAVVGIGGIFPDAPDLDSFWTNIRNGRSATRDVPAGRWQIPADAAFDPAVGVPDRVYSRRGCFIDEIANASTLDGLAIDSTRLEGLDPLFHLLIHAGKRAFDDGATASLDRSRVGVIIGNLALPSETSTMLARMRLGKSFEEKLLGHSTHITHNAPPLTDGTGTLTSNALNRHVAGLPAGILAQALGLGGGSCTLDAACASSLYAIKLAVEELLSGRADAMLTGGLSRPDPLYTQMGFSQLRALSKRGVCSPFDAAGDGLLVGEGAGLFLLKRTADAIAHGDHIYGIIKGIGVSNDVGGSLLAPMSEGQVRAMRAAYKKAGWKPSDVDLIECHATGTPVGDAVEVASLKQLWDGAEGGNRCCVIGSVKSNIGHLLTAAGGAALTKVLLAMQAETLPPTANFNTPQPGMELEQSRFRILKSAEPWQRRTANTPRRAAISAFGFGGINAHLLVEEWLPPVAAECSRNIPEVNTPPAKTAVSPIAVVGMDANFGPWCNLRAFQERVLGGDGATQPTPPVKWWGAEESGWFQQEGLDRTPFCGFYHDDLAIAPEQFRIPPREMEEMLPQQLLMLQTAAAAMRDAGLNREDNLATGVFIGIALDLNSTNFSLRWAMEGQAAEWAKKMGRELSAEELAVWTGQLREATGPALSANRTMGALGSVVASRIAREFRIGGPSFTLSSEESSGVRSLETAVRLLQAGELDRALVGSVDLAGDLRAVLAHHALQPFSLSGRALPFDQNADGAVIGEGATALVLKRLADAERDGDRIYAVIRGIGTSGGDKQPSGDAAYAHALERAYADAGVSPSSVGYLEANAGGNPDEDRREAASLAFFFDRDDMAKRSCAVAAVKSDIGDCGAASGLASVARACLALYQEIIPSCRGIEEPYPELSSGGPLFVPNTSSYWLHNRADVPRRAGVSSCGMDGSCSHVVLEGWETEPPLTASDRIAPLGLGAEFLFAFAGDTPEELKAELDIFTLNISKNKENYFFTLAKECYGHYAAAAGKALAVALVARNRDELEALIEQGKLTLTTGWLPSDAVPSLRDRFFYSPRPLGRDAAIAFVFPGSGNHYPGMGVELFSRWPEILRRQNTDSIYLRKQFQPELFWNGATAAEIDDNHLAVIFGQVATGCAVTDLVRSFGVTPSAVIGYSLGESAGLLALHAWRDRDGMYTRMHESTLFTHDMAGECRAARQAWGVGKDETISWSIGVVKAQAGQVRQLLADIPRAYLLIINTPDECVIGGDTAAVQKLVSRLGCHFFPLRGVTTVHCEVAQQVAVPYHNLHIFPTERPDGITYYSGVKGSAYDVTSESAAASILGQALHGIDYPAVVESAYKDGVRLFLEMGPGASCSRMIGRILGERPHLARSACYAGQDPVSVMLRLLANLIAERVPLELDSLFNEPGKADAADTKTMTVTVAIGGAPFHPPLPAASSKPSTHHGRYDFVQDRPLPVGGETKNIPDYSPLGDFARAQQEQIHAHKAFLDFSEVMVQSMAQAMELEMTLRLALGDDAGHIPDTTPSRPPLARGGENLASHPDKGRPGIAFDRDMCMEFATGSVARMLGSEFADVDSFPTRVRLPDEPLMLVDRIISVEGEPKSMSHGRVVTEHDIHPDAWYLDGGCIPTCIAVESGQADLFLSGYLGIDFITRGLAVYRLLDAVVTFHRGLPGPGETIHYDIHIERFFRQGDTWLFRFFYEATVCGEPLLSMRDGCAGFFSQQELDAGKGIVRPALDLRPTIGIRPADWQDLVPMMRERYNSAQLDRLREGDLAGCFGPLFNGLGLKQPLTIPGGRMRLVHRVNEIDPTGGRCGIGIIRAEADIHPDDWFITCHFFDDRVMPGTLMYECCMHTLRIYLLRLGWVAEAAGSVWEPVPGVTSELCCRGQVLESTKVVTYEVTIREIGYRPEPYVICDALMYADGKPIVEITSMSARLTGTTKEKLQTLWSVSPPLPAGEGRCEGIKPAIYTKEQILAYSNGKPSEGFGEPYRIFDSGRKIARLPGPPFQFMDRVTAVSGIPWQMTAGAIVETQYDLPADAWFFAAERQMRMPFSVLLEIALQPCGWLAAYVGSALTSPKDISFRNLGGTAVQHRAVTPDSGVLTCSATIKKVATSGGMIIQEYDFSVADEQGVLYEGDTMFGFFAKEALANQVGIHDAKPYLPTSGEITRGRSLPYPEAAPFPEKQLRMIDRIELFVPDGGPQELGYISGVKDVDPAEWFFKAHFYEDPVTPGSLGLESFIQLVKFAVVERWGWQDGDIISAAAVEHNYSWLYRGQVVPTNSRVTVSAWITAVDEQQRILTADGFLAVDGKLIYQMNDFTVKMESER
ncbi:MAG: beta-ketoacyl synthase N-terminal-like domain-containing protein [Desulfuromonadaceae bacterium]|nr:beta-ketoacyl synthase N-terminal-like domain-containing protein [Desulfuromonadaceae bacterium]